MQSRPAHLDLCEHDRSGSHVPARTMSTPGSTVDPSTSGMATPVPLIMGPTATGKTDLALRLATKYPLEIVSVDSAMVYRGMNIGTGKPSREVLRRHPHHLVDILDPLQAYSAGQF